MVPTVLLFLQLQAPLRAITDSGVVVNNMRVTPAGVQSVFDGRVHSVRFGANDGELWVAVPGNAWKLDWKSNRVIARVEFNGRPGVHGIAIDPVTGRATISSVGRLPADVAASRTPGGPPLSRAKSVTQLVTYANDSAAVPALESGPIGAFMAGAPAIAATVNAAGTRVAVVPLPADDALAVIDAASNRLLRTIPLGVLPVASVIARNGTIAWVTVFGGPKPTARTRRATQCCDPSAEPVRVDARGIAAPGTVVRVDLASGTLTHTITVGLHPMGLAWDHARNRLYVANGNSDNVSVIDTRTNTLAGTITIAPFREHRIGLAPTAVALSPDGATLLVTLGGVNAVAIYDVSKPTAGSRASLRGLVPTGWYPSSVDISSDGRAIAVGTLFGVGAGTGKLAGHTGRYVFAERGSVNVIAMPSDAELAAYTTGVAQNNRLHLSASAYSAPAARIGITARAVPERPGEASLIQHVVYIIKENRTYDQILGDIGKGASDPSLTMYGRDVTPNAHALSEQFVLLDHFFATGGNSADGHNWLTQANETAYPMWPLYLGRSYPSEGNDPLTYSSGGFIWDAAMSKGKQVVSFGEYAPAPRESKAATRLQLLNIFRDSVHDSAKSRARLRSMYDTHSEIPSLDRILVREYPGWTQEVPDVVKADVLLEHLKEWEAAGKMPDLTLMILPNDHTEGTSAGWCTPKACVADNDLGLGKIVEGLSHSSFWKSMAILVVEDDAQNGVDHMDGHRTVAMVASPYARRGVIDSTFYSQPGMVKTIELMLGLPALSMFDLVATDMRASFIAPGDGPDLTPYTALVPKQSLYDVNAQAGARSSAANEGGAVAASSRQRGALTSAALSAQRNAAIESARMNFREPDAAPTDRLNRILWQDAKGWGTPYPIVKQSLFFPLAVDVADEDRDEEGDAHDGDERIAATFSAGANILSATHPLFPRTMVGGGVSIAIRLPPTRLGVRFSATRAQAQVNRNGSTCTGQIPPGRNCEPKPLRDDVAISEFTVGALLRVIQTSRVSLDATADYGIAALYSNAHAIDGSGTLGGSANDRVAAFGFAAGWKPSVRSGFSVDAGASFGQMHPENGFANPDSYAPFLERFTTRQYRLGLSWTGAVR
jgi:YVTN family beta-propeller protein